MVAYLDDVHTGSVGIVIILSRHRMYTEQDGYPYSEQNRHSTGMDTTGAEEL